MNDDFSVNDGSDGAANQLFLDVLLKKTILSPNDIILCDLVNQYSYRDLDILSNRLANLLHASGVRFQDKVGVYLPQSANHIIAIIAIFKLGAIYVPLDTAYDKVRLAHIVEDSKLKFILYSEEKFSSTGKTVMSIYIGDAHQYPTKALQCEKAKISDVAYIIYTSGSQGKPKGVLVPHAGIVNLARAQIEAFGITKASRLFQYAAMNFDASVSEWATALLSGAALYFPNSHEDKLGDALVQLCNRYSITILTLPPSMLLALNEWQFTSLETLVLAGEKLCPNLLDIIPGNIAVFNAYGPTEATVCCTIARVTPHQPINCIGKPIAHVGVQVLNNRLEHVKEGEIGEVYISGIGLARGYLNASLLTQKKFVDGKIGFNVDRGFTGRLYVTGDLARVLSDGSLEYVGRVDQQVKYHGQRVSLSEIESLILSYQPIKDALVKVVESEFGQDICAYVIFKDRTDGHSESIDRLKEFLENKLPKQLIPKPITSLAAWPLTENGKIDHSQLLLAHGVVANDGDKPLTVESKLQSLWLSILKLTSTKINSHDNFFQLGGDSISAMRLRLEAKRNGMILKIKDIYRCPTFEGMCTVIQGATDSPLAPLSVNPLSTSTLTPIQHWFFEQHFEVPCHWNQWVTLQVSEKINHSLLIKIVSVLLSKYDVFRLYIDKINSKGEVTVAYDVKKIDIHSGCFIHESLENLSKEQCECAISEKINAIQASLNFYKGETFKIYFVESDYGNKLIFIMHHLIVDAVSWHVLISEMNYIANAFLENGHVLRNQSVISFQAWVNDLSKYVANKSWVEELAYWHRYPSKYSLNNVLQTRNRSIFNQRLIEANFSGIGSLQSDILTNTDHRLHDVLVAALCYSCRKLNGDKDFYINLESHGRDIDLPVDTSEYIGWFTSLYPFWVSRDSMSSADVYDLVKIVSDALARIPNKGASFGILKYLHPDSAVNKLLSDKATPQICFNYLGNFSGDHADSKLFCEDNNGIQFSSSPKNRTPHAVEINTYLSKGDLRVSVMYDENQIRTNHVEALIQGFEQFLFQFKNSQTSTHKLKSYPLTTLQSNLYHHHQKVLAENKLDDTYIVQGVFHIQGVVDYDRLELAWVELVNRHQALKVIFSRNSNGVPVQSEIISPSSQWQFFDAKDVADINEYVNTVRIKQRATAFHINRLPLTRQALIQSTESNYYLIITLHHIIADGWCTEILIRELLIIYHSKLNSTTSLSKPFDMLDYYSWIENQDAEKSADFWRQYLNNAEPNLICEQRLGDSQCQDNDDGYYVKKTKLCSEDAAMLKSYICQNNTTLAILVQVSWAIICSLYLSKKESVFGYVVSGRHIDLDGIDQAVNLISQTVPIRVLVNDDSNVVELINRLYSIQPFIFEHSHCPLSEIFSQASTHGNRLFDTLLVVENYPSYQCNAENEFDFSINGVEWHEKTEYPVTCSVFFGDTIELQIASHTSVVDKYYTDQILEDFHCVLELIASSAIMTVSELKHQLCCKYEKIIKQWNSTDFLLPKTENIYDYFESCSKLWINSVAIVQNEKSVTYGELITEINKTAHKICLKRNAATKYIAVFMSRSVDCIVSMLAILKCGLAYLPIDISYPDKRINDMIAHAEVNIVLTTIEHVNRLISTAHTILVDQVSDEDDDFLSEGIYQYVRLDNVANLIYTSGSTGEPKGVLTTHRGLLNRVLWMKENYNIKQTDKVMFKTSISFDVSGWEIFLPLLSGGQCHIVPDGMQSEVSYLNNLIEHSGITCLHFVPTMLSAWLDSLNKNQCQSLRYVFSSGEPLSLKAAQRYYSVMSARLINLYGPTEAAIDVTHWSCQQAAKTIYIGRPIANTQIHLLDSDGLLVPNGVVGEIYIGGMGVAKGYLNAPELTSYRFPSLIIDGKNRILFKTGDLARFTADGNIEYIGRNDNQIKLRGFRIEPGEIEQCLLKLNYLKNVSVDVRDVNGHTKLIAYVALMDQDQSDWQSKAILLLKSHLPTYMVPDYFINIEFFPVTINGKIDKAQLAKIAIEKETVINEFLPSNDYEAKFLSVCREIMKSEEITLDDNFFAIGGDSIISILIANRLRKLGSKILVNDIMSAPTLRESSRRSMILENISDQKMNLISPVNQKNTKQYPLTVAQLGILLNYIKNNDSGVRHSYIIHRTYAIEGFLDVEKFKDSWMQVLESTPQLNVRFSWRKLSEPLQIMLDNQPILFEVDQTDNWQRDVMEWKKTSRSLLSDLEKTPLQSFKLLKCDECHFIFVWSNHHILFDGWSQQLLLERVKQAYFNIYGSEPNLNNQEASFSQYFDSLTKADDQKLEFFWKNYLNHSRAMLLSNSLVTDVSTSNHDNRVFSSKITVELTASIQDCCKKLGLSCNTLLQYAWAQTLCDYKKTTHAVFGTVHSGRNTNVAAIDDLVGLFVQTVPCTIEKQVGDLNVSVLSELQETISEISSLPPVSLSQILGWCSKGSALFDTLYVYENYPSDFHFDNENRLTFNLVEVYEYNEYPLTVIIVPDKSYTISFIYQYDLISDNEIKLLSDAYHEKIVEIIATLGVTKRISQAKADNGSDNVFQETLY